jgi:hypothetical protein
MHPFVLFSHPLADLAHVAGGCATAFSAGLGLMSGAVNFPICHGSKLAHELANGALHRLNRQMVQNFRFGR